MYEDLLDKRAQAQDDLEVLEASGGASREAAIRREHLLDHLNALNVALDEPIVENDPVVARWEREMAEGRVPNFKERLSDG